MADAQIAELQEQKEALPRSSRAAKQIQHEISSLTERRKSAVNLVEQLESGTADPHLEQQVASEAIKEAEQQIEALQQESEAHPSGSTVQRAIAKEIQELQVTKESAEDMLAKAEATLKIQNAQRSRKARQEVAARRDQKRKENDAAVKIQSIQRGKTVRNQAPGKQSAPAVASAVVEMADAQIAELEQQKDALRPNSHASKEIQQEIGALTMRRQSAANLVNQLEAGEANPELEQQTASFAIEETLRQIKLLEQERESLQPDDSEWRSKINVEIEQLQEQLNAAQEMLTQAQAALKIQSIHRGKKARQEVAAQRAKLHSGQSGSEVASAVLGMTDAQIAELEEETKMLCPQSERTLEIKQELNTLATRRQSAVDLLAHLQEGTSDAASEEQIASIAIHETEKQLEMLEIEAKSLAPGSEWHETINQEIEQLQETKEAAEAMLAEAQAALKIQNAARARKARQEITARKEQKKKEEQAAVRIQSRHRGNQARRLHGKQDAEKQSPVELASSVIELASEHIGDLQVEMMSLPRNSLRRSKINEEISVLRSRRHSAEVVAAQGGSSDSAVEADLASYVAGATNRRISVLQEEKRTADPERKEEIGEELEMLKERRRSSAALLSELTGTTKS
eukprot:gnl/MRDRNA2_/MRDRNA2_154713_c0_seq1.p1 gnl/MRDRNA2_/MRDRNA2_154713_c0~~gnl/MRDRNA2_/MRDRNA2_154713_c0_seq1.p1  ORF type:complete len:725 (+),score=240.97 gnl/MRDRNA2_/MRDRNA2_154713_c0_seq1:290-2176(+)